MFSKVVIFWFAILVKLCRGVGFMVVLQGQFAFAALTFGMQMQVM